MLSRIFDSTFPSLIYSSSPDLAESVAQLLGLREYSLQPNPRKKSSNIHLSGGGDMEWN